MLDTVGYQDCEHSHSFQEMYDLVSTVTFNLYDSPVREETGAWEESGKLNCLRISS